MNDQKLMAIKTDYMQVCYTELHSSIKLKEQYIYKIHKGFKCKHCNICNSNICTMIVYIKIYISQILNIQYTAMDVHIEKVFLVLFFLK